MIPSKSKALLVAKPCDSGNSLALNWAGLGLALVFLAFAAYFGS